MQVEGAQWKGFKDCLGQNEAIGDDDRHIRGMGARGAYRLRRAQGRRRE
jgi:hypothetical protein